MFYKLPLSPRSAVILESDGASKQNKFIIIPIFLTEVKRQKIACDAMFGVHID